MAIESGSVGCAKICWHDVAVAMAASKYLDSRRYRRRQAGRAPLWKLISEEIWDATVEEDGEVCGALHADGAGQIWREVVRSGPLRVADFSDRTLVEEPDGALVDLHAGTPAPVDAGVTQKKADCGDVPFTAPHIFDCERRGQRWREFDLHSGAYLSYHELTRTSASERCSSSELASVSKAHPDKLWPSSYQYCSRRERGRLSAL